jgi:hypothetical protein
VRRFIPLIVMLGLLTAACPKSDEAASSTPAFSNEPLPSGTATMAPPVSATPTAPPTAPATPAVPPPTSGPVTSTCMNGWVTPPAGARRFTDPLGLIRAASPTRGDFVVVDMRYFVGPESPASDQGYLQDIERWYIKLYDAQNPAYQGRFLVELRRFGRGVAAVAPYDTRGFRSPDWSGFQWNDADRTRNAYEGLPGTWQGVRYDFVKGGAGLTFPGLPRLAKGCLAGT